MQSSSQLNFKSGTLDVSSEILFINNPVPMFVYDWESLSFLAANNAAVEHYGFSEAQFLKMTIPDMRPVEDRVHVANLVRSSQGDLRQGIATRHQKSDGSLVDVIVYSRPMNLRGFHIGLAAAFDVTDRKRAESHIAYMAMHDALTDLPNRTAFMDNLKSVLNSATKENKPAAVVCLDLDRFKEVNDAFGHHVGDVLLCEASKRMQRASQGAFLARLGGDEFMLIVTNEPDSRALIAVTDRLIDAFKEPFVIEENNIFIGVSAGVAVFPIHGTDGTTLLRKADAALYSAKAAGRGLAQVFDRDMDDRLQERGALSADLHSAIRNDEFTLFFQPQARITGEIIGFEALIRWRHPQRGVLSPNMFIPLAEEMGLILEIGEWALREACREAASWKNPVKVAVNISPMQFRHGDLVSLVHTILLETGLSANRLELEITESVLIDDLGRALFILRRIKAFGVQIALDDFGTGYSSLSYLQSFPFDRIKIDRSFISKVQHDPQSRAIVRAVIGLALGLNLSVTAEGVETEDQFEFLSCELCPEVQGYLVGRPEPINHYAEITRSFKVLEAAARNS